MKVRLEISLEQANVIHKALLDRIRFVRASIKAVAATPEERQEFTRELMLIEQTFRVLGLEIPEDAS